ncbi:hypothetical protein [Nonomuraea dietziae]|uniref:hypothetical protein n=1 Tax=Nonomuraea dietziae TaxID=65515 RepID=UPI0033CB9B29
MVGPEDELVARVGQFREELLLVDLDLPVADREPGKTAYDADDGSMITVDRSVVSEDPVAPYEPERPVVAPRLDDVGEVYAALVLGVRDYVAKDGFPSVILDLSGGLDSALTVTIASSVIGPERANVVLMPSRYYSEGREVVGQARAAGHHVTAVVREPGDLAATVVADIFDPPSLIPLLTGDDAVADRTAGACRSNVWRRASRRDAHTVCRRWAATRRWPSGPRVSAAYLVRTISVKKPVYSQ